MADPLPCAPAPARAAELREAVLAKYARVAARPDGQFSYPVGRRGALGVGYEAAHLDAVPAAAAEAFVGVGNPLSLVPPRAGDRVLDLGCGAGTDVFLAAARVGARGIAVGVDLSVEMLGRAAAAAPGSAAGRARFVAGDLESLPFRSGGFDAAISNGVLNLVPDKARALREAARVLRPGGVLAMADLLVVETVPDEVLADAGAWST